MTYLALVLIMLILCGAAFRLGDRLGYQRGRDDAEYRELEY